MIEVRVVNGQARMPVRRARIEAAVRAALAGSGVLSAEIGVAVVDAATIRDLNRRHLDHDHPTDVLSFPLEQSDRRLEGEIVVSADAAAAAAPRYGWPPGDELLLYVVHGVLHLVGLDDRTPGQRAAMRRRERACLAVLNVRTPPRRRPEKGDKSNLCEAPGGPLRGKLDLSPFSGRRRARSGANNEEVA